MNTSVLNAQRVAFVRPAQYFDKFVLTRAGIGLDTDHDVKTRLGFADAQRFSQTIQDAVTRVASTRVGDDCGEGFQAPSEWSKAFAGLDRAPGAASP